MISRVYNSWEFKIEMLSSDIHLLLSVPRLSNFHSLKFIDSLALNLKFAILGTADWLFLRRISE